MKIFVNGTFDIIHTGHIELLNYARSLGAYLLVAIDTDQRVRALKGASRPINTQVERKLLLENLKAVNAVELFSTDKELEHIIQVYEPDIMVKGSDYRGCPIVGEEFVAQVVFFERINDYSSTRKIQDIIDRR